MPEPHPPPIDHGFGSAGIGRVRALFEAALAVPTAERPDYLAKQCAGDAELRRSVEELLASDAVSVGPLEIAGSAPAAVGLEGQSIGGFAIEQLLGRGGTAAVYAATQVDPPRRVALKVLPGLLSAAAGQTRFQREGALLSRLEHPGIARLYEVGEFQFAGQSLPYLALELVRDARTLTDHARAEGLSVERRLELFAQVCEAVGYGHGLGVVHRDLKPANILVDADGRPRIVDFGIARAIGVGDEALARMTVTGQMLGTPRYMSPEQHEGAAVGVRSDVWSLGVVLHELLTGRHPFPIDDVSWTAIAGVVGTARPARLRDIDTPWRSDLDIVLTRCLAIDPADRYAAADVLGDEIQRVLAGQPIQARAHHAAYVLRKRLARHRLALGVGAAILALATAATVIMAVLLQSAEDANARSAQSLYWSSIALAASSLDAGRFAEARQTLADCPAAFRGWEWSHLIARVDDAVWTARPDTAQVKALCVAPDGKLLAVANVGPVVHLLNATTGAVQGRLEGHARGVAALAFVAPASTQLLSGSWDGTARLWDVTTRRELRSWRHPDEVLAMAVAPGGRTFATGDRSGTMRLWQLGAAQPMWQVHAHDASIMELAFSPDGSLLASGGSDRRIGIWDPQSGQQLHDIDKSVRQASNGFGDVDAHRAAITGLAFHRNGRFLFSASDDGLCRMWDARTGALLFFETIGQRLGKLALSPDGETLAIAAQTVIELRSTIDGRHGEPMRGHDDHVFIATFAPDGERVITGAADGAVRCFLHGQRSGASNFAIADAAIFALCLSADRSTMAAGDEAGFVHVFDAATLTRRHTFRAHEARVRSMALDATGRHLVTCADDLTMRLWETASQKQLAMTAVPMRATACWRDSGIHVAGEGTTIVRHDAANLTPLARFELPDADLAGFDVDAAGRRAVTGTRAGQIRLWDLATGRLLQERDGHGQKRLSLVRFLDDTRLATGAVDQALRIWSLPNLELIEEFTHVINPVALAEAPSGRRLLVCPSRGNPLVLLPGRGRALIELTGHDNGVIMRGLLSLGDGRFVTADSGGVLRVWSDQPLGPR